MLNAVPLRGLEILFQIPLPRPELSNNEAVRPGLNEIDTDLLGIQPPAQLANRLIGDYL